MRRKSIYPHKSLRYMPFRNILLLQGLVVAVVTDVVLLWQMTAILDWHTQALQRLLDLAEVPWEVGRQITIVPGVAASLVRTTYLDYQVNPMSPWYVFSIVAALFLVGYRYFTPPLRPLFALVPVGLGVTAVYLQWISPSLPYSPEDFCAIWYRGEAFLWLLLPWIFGLGLFTLDVPFALKLPWLLIVFMYSLLWSVVRLAMAVATFYYFGSIWMPVFYFIAGFLADFLYIVACYSLAMDRAAGYLVKQREVWQA